MNVFHRIVPYQSVLWLLSALGLFGLNGVFLYYAFLRPDVMAAAYQNPVSLVFILEAFVMIAFGAWVIARMGLERPGWLAFVAMSLIGSLAFSVPFFLLLHLRKRRAAEGTASARSTQQS